MLGRGQECKANGRPGPERPTCRGCLAPLRKAAEPRRVMLEDMGDDVQVVGRERGLDVAAGRDIGHAEVDLALLGARGLDQHNFGMVGPPRVMSGVWWKSERKASSSGAVEPQLR